MTHLPSFVCMIIEANLKFANIQKIGWICQVSWRSWSRRSSIRIVHLLTIVKRDSDCFTQNCRELSDGTDVNQWESEKVTIRFSAYGNKLAWLPPWAIHGHTRPYTVVSDSMGPAEPICWSNCITCTFPKLYVTTGRVSWTIHRELYRHFCRHYPFDCIRQVTEHTYTGSIKTDHLEHCLKMKKKGPCSWVLHFQSLVVHWPKDEHLRSAPNRKWADTLWWSSYVLSMVKGALCWWAFIACWDTYLHLQ